MTRNTLVTPLSPHVIFGGTAPALYECRELFFLPL